jgi:dTDP-4-dehydrorhamnose 3,5-epimerase
VDYDKESPTYKQWQAFTLSDKNNMQILVPPLRANGHLVLSDVAIFSYKQSTYYQGVAAQFTVLWNDPELNIYWPLEPHIVSKRDSGWML